MTRKRNIRDGSFIKDTLASFTPTFKRRQPKANKIEGQVRGWWAEQTGGNASNGQAMW